MVEKEVEEVGAGFMRELYENSGNCADCDECEDCG